MSVTKRIAAGRVLSEATLASGPITITRQLHQSLPRVESIDALRGLAALSVLIFHARGIFWIGFVNTYHRYGTHFNLEAWLGYLTEPFSYGWLGVNLFFVLSGYCIHRRGAMLLAANPQARLDIASFALRRFWRIYPTYTSALILTAALGWWMARLGSDYVAGQDRSIFSFLISILTLQGYLAPYFGDNGVFWTLAIEVHLYAVYPVLFYLSRRYGARMVVWYTLTVAIVYIVLNHIFEFENNLPYRSVQGPIFLPYWFTWAMGFYVAEIKAGRARDFTGQTWSYIMIGGALLGLPPVLHNSHPEYADLFWAIFFAGLVRWSLTAEGTRFWNRSLGRGLAAIGIFSYSLYAIHAPILHLLHSILAKSDAEKFTTIWPTVGAVLVAIGAAWLFFLLVERWSILRPAPALKRMKGASIGVVD